MGTDIDAYVEIRDADGVWQYAGDVFPDNEFPDDRHCPFDSYRNYNLFGFLANVRNDVGVPTIAPPRGLPPNVSGEVRYELEIVDGGTSWLTLAELQRFDYDQTFTVQRSTPYEATVREALGDWYFGRLALLAKLGDPEDVRIVFGFGG